MNKKRFLVIIFFILLLFSFSSLAAIPGDFNSDSRVDFEDLMIFALAYGSTSGSSNWNPSCDLDPDSKINFEDLMLFALHYGEEETTGPVHNLNQGTYYATIQGAIDAANSGDIIEVYEGTYHENILFDGKNITVRSINPLDLDIVAATIIDGGENDSVVTFKGGDSSNLTGFTIQNGNAGSGVGIYVYYSSPTITGNTITKNTAGTWGGGIAVCNYSSPTISGNTINHNTAVYGGGIYVSLSSPTISDNYIMSNVSNGGNGGGIYVYDGSPSITGNDIKNNVVSSEGSGGGIYVNSTSSPNIGGADLSDTANFNTICGNYPDQIEAPNSYPFNYIFGLCFS